MTAKEGVRQALKVIGLEGLAGAYVPANSAVEAYVQLVTDLFDDTSTRQHVYRELKRQGLIYITEVDNGFRVGVTPKGGLKLLQIQADDVSIPPMKKWDQKWRLVCFDIPKGKNSERLYLNRRLHELQFTMLQRSMWVHPFECMEEMRIITDYLNLTRYVTVLEVTKLDEQNTRRLLRTYESVLNA